MLLADQLHACLQDPVLASINFLNEVMEKFPNAISFAPGAPHPTHLSNLDINQYIERYLDYLCEVQGMGREAAQRLLYQYGPARGILNTLIASVLIQDKKIDVSPDALVITVGAQEAMLLVLRALFRTNSAQLAVVTPCFVGILGAARLLDLSVFGVPETDMGIDLEALERCCREAHRHQRPIRALYIAPDYANPGGTCLTLEMRHQLLALADHHDFYVIEDNAYGFTAPPGEALPSLKALDKAKRVILIGTFAKTCLPGARVGYVVADQDVQDKLGKSHILADDLAAIKSMVTINTSPICQAIIGGMLLMHEGSLAALEHTRALVYRENLALLLEKLGEKLSSHAGCIQWNRPTGGFFVRMRLPVQANMQLLECAAERYGVMWAPMAPFYLDKTGDHELRLSCSYLTPPEIEEGVERFATFLIKEVLS